MLFRLCICCCIVPIVIIGISGTTCGIVLSKWMNKEDFAGPKYIVTDAAFNKFAVTSNNTLDYELALTVVAENKFYGNTEIKWERFETIPVYENEELGKVDLAPFEIKKVSKKELKPSYKGEKKMSVDASKVKNSELVDIVLKLQAKRTGKTVYFFNVKNDFEYQCKLKVPTKSRGDDFLSTMCVKNK